MKFSKSSGKKLLSVLSDRERTALQILFGKWDKHRQKQSVFHGFMGWQCYTETFCIKQTPQIAWFTPDPIPTYSKFFTSTLPAFYFYLDHYVSFLYFFYVVLCSKQLLIFKYLFLELTFSTFFPLDAVLPFPYLSDPSHPLVSNRRCKCSSSLTCL